MPRWKVNKRNGSWCVYDSGILWDGFDTLVEAHTAAMQNAVIDAVCEPGGLTCLANLKSGSSSPLTSGNTI